MKMTPCRATVVMMALSLSLTAPVQAEPASRASLESMFQVMHAQTLLDGIYDAMDKSMSQFNAKTSEQLGESPARRRILAKAREDSMGLVRSEISWEKIEPMMMDVYQKALTEEEVTATINFYSTPVGQAILVKMPQLAQSAMSGVQPILQALAPRLREITKKALADADAADAAATALDGHAHE